MKIVQIASEVAPWSQTGGLADVTAALSKSLTHLAPDNQVVVFSPFYSCVRQRATAEKLALDTTIANLEVRVGSSTHRVNIIRAHTASRLQHCFVDCPSLFDRPGLYAPPDQGSYDDNDIRFALLCKAAIDAGAKILQAQPDVIHCHDWQAALALMYARASNTEIPVSVFTIHNLAYQGVFEANADRLGLDPSMLGFDGIEFHGRSNLLKGGIMFADHVTTVSPRYAKEILTPEFGCGLDGLLNAHKDKLTGIANGIDLDSWDPAQDPHLPHPYSHQSLDGRSKNRLALLQELSLPTDEGEMLIGIVSRLDAQKGLDLVAEAAHQFQSRRWRLAVLGCGDPNLARLFHGLASKYENIALHDGFDIGLARRMYAGADVMLIPSRFEPCGLTQLYAMRYGSVPIVNPVGGLRDTVIDPRHCQDHQGQQQTGFHLRQLSTDSLLDSLTRVAQDFANRQAWRQIVLAGMTRDSSWQASAQAYMTLYQKAKREQ